MQDLEEQKLFHESAEGRPLTSFSLSQITPQSLSVATPKHSINALELGSPKQQYSASRKRSHTLENSSSKFYRTDFPETLTQAVHLLEHDYYPARNYESEVNSDASTEIVEQKLDSFDLPIQNKNYNFLEDNPSDLSGNFMYNSNSPCSTHSQKMYPASVDQTRQETLHPQTVHVHMHQFCSCMHPYYSGYRPPIMAPYHVPVPRPYNLQHYQYTQFNLSPYNFPVMHANTAITPPPPNTPTTVHQIPLDFGPPPRDKRTFETTDVSSQGEVTNEVSKENLFEDYLPSLADGNVQESTHNFMTTTENFTKYLEQGCIIAEKIAIRNQHRPCFKNIQNLCNRTRSEILKPSNTVSNIHSQGIPWATKDFIYAFVRLINCWHMLKGYLDSKDGTLGNIDRELTPEFKNCYLAWEKNTKELAAHMIRIFTNLDNNVSNPNAIIHKSKSTLQESPQKPLSDTTLPKITKENNGKIGRSIPQEIVETIVLSESTETSPRDEDSDNESRVYMKPGSYSVPKKNDSSNSSPSIEFFDTAQNVSAHYKKMARKKQDAIPTVTDKMWQDAQSAVPYLMNKMIPPPQIENAVKIPSGEVEENALKYFVDLNRLDQGSNIQEWLNSNNFFENQNGSGENDTLVSPRSPKPVAVLQRSSLPKLIHLGDQNGNNEFNLKGGGCAQRGCNSTTTRAYRKRNEEKVKSSQKKNLSGIWEYDKGGLTANAIVAAEEILKNLEKEEFTKRMLCVTDDKEDDSELEIPSSLSAIKRKLTSRKYNYLQEFVGDMRNLVSCSIIYYETRPEISEQMSLFGEKFEELLSAVFPSFDFSAITGEPKEEVGPASLRRGKKSDGDGDH